MKAFGFSLCGILTKTDRCLYGAQAGGFIGSGNGKGLVGGVKNCYSLATIKVSSGTYVGAVYGGVWSCGNNTITNFYTTSSKLWGNNGSNKANVITGATAKGDAAINDSDYNVLGDAFVRIGDNYPMLKSFTDLPDNIPWNGLGDSSYIVDGMGDKAPMLRIYGTTIGDVDENGEFMLSGDAAALRQTLIGAKALKNADSDKNVSIDICDLVSLYYK